jgi:BarA-like signal transduction histidine kinase
MADSLKNKESARIELNSMLGEITTKVMRECPNANIFKCVVQVSKMRDYLSFVEPLDAAMCLEQILSRTDCCFYSSIEQFQGDFQILLANAVAYNTLGHGTQAQQEIICSARSMIDYLSSELQHKLQDLLLLEARFQVRVLSSNFPPLL